MDEIGWILRLQNSRRAFAQARKRGMLCWKTTNKSTRIVLNHKHDLTQRGGLQMSCKEDKMFPFVLSESDFRARFRFSLEISTVDRT